MTLSVRIYKTATPNADLDTLEMPPKKFKGGKTGWYVRKTMVIDGKRYTLNFMIYSEKA
jgi:hypothetical protein